MKDKYWLTPKDIYEKLDKEFSFDFDPCPLNFKEDGLLIDWGERNFINPPYSRKAIKLWVKKCKNEAFNNNALVVALLPLRSALWFRDNILPFFKLLYRLEDWIYLDVGDCGFFFMEKRIRFYDHHLGAPIKDYPNFDNVIVIWRGLK